MKRILAFTLIFAMLFTAMLGIMPAAEGEAAKLEITHANLEFASNVYLLVAVNYTGVCADEAEALEKVYITVGGDKVTADADLTADEDTPAGCVAFKYTKISAKEIGDVYEIAAFVDGEAEAQDTTTYSILEYAVKAKATSNDDNLKAAVIAMLDFGAAAQAAFDYEGDYALSENNADGIGYGMVIIGGADEATRKTLAATGTQVDPVMDTTVFAKDGDGKIYDMNFEARNLTNRPIKVTEGISRYFYYGSDIAGDTTKFMDFTVTAATSGTPGSAGLGSLKIVTGLDFAGQYAGDVQSYDFSAHGGLNRKTSIAYATGASYKIQGIQNNSARLANSRVRPWQVDIWGSSDTGYYTGPKGTPSLELAQGYLFVKPSASNKGANAINISNAHSGRMNAFLDAEGKMTVSVTIAVGASCGYISCDFHTNFTHAKSTGAFADFLPTVSDPVHIFGINGHTLSIGGSVIEVTTSGIKEDWSFVNQTVFGSVKNYTQGDDATAIDDADFTTYHFVLDANNGTVTAYTAGQLGGVTVKVADGAFSAAQLDYFFNRTYRGETIIRRIALSEGDIFK